MVGMPLGGVLRSKFENHRNQEALLLIDQSILAETTKAQPMEAIAQEDWEFSQE
jgi:hypothetical protein